MIYDPPDMDGCNCAQCQRSRRVSATLETGDMDAFRALIHELYTELMHTEMDLNYAQAVVDGSWPDAASVIRTTRARLKKKRAQARTASQVNKKAGI